MEKQSDCKEWHHEAILNGGSPKKEKNASQPNN
jgi:hypothetical protein